MHVCVCAVARACCHTSDIVFLWFYLVSRSNGHTHICTHIYAHTYIHTHKHKQYLGPSFLRKWNKLVTYFKA